jgi:hypothetical protein
MRQVESRDIERLVDGDLSVVEVVRAAPHGAVRSAWEHSSEPILTAAAVRRVLSDLAAGTTEPELVQQWASFIMRGTWSPSARLSSRSISSTSPTQLRGPDHRGDRRAGADR